MTQNKKKNIKGIAFSRQYILTRVVVESSFSYSGSHQKCWYDGTEPFCGIHKAFVAWCVSSESVDWGVWPTIREGDIAVLKQLIDMFSVSMSNVFFFYFPRSKMHLSLVGLCYYYSLSKGFRAGLCLT